MKDKFRKHVELLKKPGQDILDSLDAKKCDLLHMAGCVQEEASELYNPIKKHIFYNKPLDIANVRGELGDLLFYIEGVALNLGIDLDEIKAENIEKLKARYPEGYSDVSAQKRADMKLCTCCGAEMEKAALSNYKTDEELCLGCGSETIVGGLYLGSKVRAIYEVPGQFTAGNIYEVCAVGIFPEGYIDLEFVNDDSGRTTNGWGSDNFKVVAHEG